jgi:hypothetical protein
MDTETTGVHPGRRAWEVAIIRRESDGTEETFHAFIGDVNLSNADPMGLKIGGFYERHPAYAGGVRRGGQFSDGTSYSEWWVAEEVERLTRGAHIVGCVPNFDTEVFAEMLRRYNLAPAWHYHLIDVEALAVGYLAGRADELNLPARYVELPWSSDDLSRACGVEPASEEERHTALGDARWAMRLYDAIVHGKVAVAA